MQKQTDYNEARQETAPPPYLVCQIEMREFVINYTYVNVILLCLLETFTTQLFEYEALFRDYTTTLNRGLYCFAPIAQ